MAMEISRELSQVMEKHKKQCEQWREGKPVKVFTQDGLPCVKYESGAWWHYDVKNGTWY